MDNLNLDYLTILDKTGVYVLPTVILLTASLTFIIGATLYEINKPKINNMFYRITHHKNKPENSKSNSLDDLF